MSGNASSACGVCTMYQRPPAGVSQLATRRIVLHAHAHQTLRVSTHEAPKPCMRMRVAGVCPPGRAAVKCCTGLLMDSAEVYRYRLAGQAGKQAGT